MSQSLSCEVMQGGRIASPVTRLSLSTFNMFLDGYLKVEMELIDFPFDSSDV